MKPQYNRFEIVRNEIENSGVLPKPLRLGRKSVFHVHRPHNKKDSTFFSHGSAIWIHGLNEDHKNIFINNEQSPKPKPSSYH
jgi:hypothetical protein